MIEFYVYGFKSRDAYTKKSARSYDDERRRIESWLGEYMSFRQNYPKKELYMEKFMLDASTFFVIISANSNKKGGNSMTIDIIRERVALAADEFSLSRITLFGSRANGTNREDSDVDLIVEFSSPVSLLIISALRCRLEELLGVDVDVIHGPIQSDDMIEVGKVIELYAA